MGVLVWPGLDNHSTEINEVWSILEKPGFNRFSSKTILKCLSRTSKLQREKKFGCARLPGLEIGAAALLANENMSQESTMLDLPFVVELFSPMYGATDINQTLPYIYIYIYI